MLAHMAMLVLALLVLVVVLLVEFGDGDTGGSGPDGSADDDRIDRRRRWLGVGVRTDEKPGPQASRLRPRGLKEALENPVVLPGRGSASITGSPGLSMPTLSVLHICRSVV